MRVAIACDHVGFALKTSIIEALEQDEHAVLDLGTHGPDPTEYPPIAKAVAVAVGKNFVDRGVVLTVSGIGGAIVANRFSGIRAAAASDSAMARDSREQVDANVLSVSAEKLTPEAAIVIVREWMSVEFSGTSGVLSRIGEVAGMSVPRSASAARTAVTNGPPPSATVAEAAPAAADDTAASATEAPKPSDITAVMKLIASVTEPDMKMLATRVLQFIRNRFPTATGTPTSSGFVFTLDDLHVASVTIGKNFVELEAGPSRVSTGKIRDVERLEVVLELPRITSSFDGIKT
jgi:ribose 5-phosphate isomerase B